ncbi:unnamed protein product [Dicrocoelium dendriticum]|nr:unnamed protein product [Dicrocoelium dendriticum]
MAHIPRNLANSGPKFPTSSVGQHLLDCTLCKNPRNPFNVISRQNNASLLRFAETSAIRRMKLNLCKQVTGAIDPTSYVTRLRQHFSSIRPAPPRISPRSQQVHPDLHTCPFIFVRVDSVRISLTPPYEDPFKVVAWREKHFVLDRNGH